VKNSSPATSEERVQLVAGAAEEARALELVILQVGKLLPFCEYFVICHGRSPLHCEAICDQVEERLAQAGMRAHHREGEPRGEWTLLDYADIVLHVFSESARNFYGLERLWAEAPRVELRSPVPPAEGG
jgi:ribosome-associated protein